VLDTVATPLRTILARPFVSYPKKTMTQRCVCVQMMHLAWVYKIEKKQKRTRCLSPGDWWLESGIRLPGYALRQGVASFNP